MKLNKSLAILAILGATTLFAADINSVNALVEKINKTTDVKIKNQLMQDLDKELKSLNKKDQQEAQEIVETKLKRS